MLERDDLTAGNSGKWVSSSLWHWWWAQPILKNNGPRKVQQGRAAKLKWVLWLIISKMPTPLFDADFNGQKYTEAMMASYLAENAHRSIIFGRIVPLMDIILVRLLPADNADAFISWVYLVKIWRWRRVGKTSMAITSMVITMYCNTSKKMQSYCTNGNDGGVNI